MVLSCLGLTLPFAVPTSANEFAIAKFLKECGDPQTDVKSLMKVDKKILLFVVFVYSVFIFVVVLVAIFIFVFALRRRLRIYISLGLSLRLCLLLLIYFLIYLSWQVDHLLRSCRLKKVFIRAPIGPPFVVVELVPSDDGLFFVSFVHFSCAFIDFFRIFFIYLLLFPLQVGGKLFTVASVSHSRAHL